MLNKYIGIGVVIGLAVFSYFVYDYGYTKGWSEMEEQRDQQIAKLEAEAIKHQKILNEAQTELANRAKDYEQLRSRLALAVKENQKWKETFAEAKNRSLSIATVERLNYLLSH